MHYRVAKNGGARLEVDIGPGFLGFPHRSEWRNRLTQQIFLIVNLALAADGELEGFRQGIDYRNTHSVETAGNFIRFLIKLSASVQYGHNHFRSGAALRSNDAGRNPATVIRNSNRIVGMNNDPHLGTIACKNLIDGIINRLKHHMVQAGTIVSVADVHPWALTYRI